MYVRWSSVGTATEVAVHDLELYNLVVPSEVAGRPLLL